MQPNFTTSADIQITIPSCKCGEKEFTVSASDLNDALGCIECDRCGTMLYPAQTDLENAAVNVAMDEMLAESRAAGVLAHRPSVFFGGLAERKSAVLKRWGK